MYFPEPDRIYYLQSSNIPDCYATIIPSDTALRRVPLNPDKFYQKVFCTFTEVTGARSLGVNSVDQFEPVYTFDNAQTWILKKSLEGYTIGQRSGDSEFVWTARKESEPIVIARGIVNTESWRFVPAPEQ
ncbi:uncharacterized protein EDB91DRAFT_1080697 [Suillus paluster]|uniref:uncharacterized protein n=1 Tax=Suillus paluster TaxID=48578 RepID=UPI001B886C91|nr:uncharacterized protein EDB91DRAFT_1080697 [Suillus paluster]KAG1744595.1 hypothetical protein EDB91DRAFT_1080697 [Suillus paluster]